MRKWINKKTPIITSILLVFFCFSGVDARRKKKKEQLDQPATLQAANQNQENITTTVTYSQSEPSGLPAATTPTVQVLPTYSGATFSEPSHGLSPLPSLEEPQVTLKIENPEEVKQSLQPEQLKIKENSAQQEPEEVADIYLNFENTELSNFINYMVDLKKLNVIPDKTIAGNKISLSVRKPVTISGAWKIFLTVLEMAGFTVNQPKGSDVCKIIPKNQKIRQPLLSFINVPLDSLPDSDATIRYVTFLNNISVGDVKELLSSMLGQPNLVIEQPNVNGFIITAKSYDIKAAMKVIHELDQTGLQESVVVLRLKESNAKDVKELFDTLISKPEGNTLARLLGRQTENTTAYFSPTTKIIAEERTNSLILLGTIQSIEKIENFIKENIDTQLKEVKSPLRIFELQYADAEQIAEILNEVTNPQNLDTEAGQNAAKYGFVRGGVKFFKPMKFKVDKEGNRLIVSCSDDQDWNLLKKTIQDLDKAQPQVAIEVLIVSINVTDNKILGSQVRNKREGMIGRNIDFQAANLSPTIQSTTNPQTLLGNMLSAVTSTLGQTLLTFGRSTTNGVWGILEMLKSVVNTTVLSQPFITIANNGTATLSVGQTRRIPQQEAVSDTGTIGSATGFITKPVFTKINITPQINIEGLVKFNLDVTISSFTDAVGDTVEQFLKTSAIVADGQVLVLGGFVKTQVTDIISKTPVLSDIPLLGWLFKSLNRSIIKQYTFIFMCPVIVKPRSTPGVELYTKMKLHTASDDVEDAIETKRTNDPVQNLFFNYEGENYSHKVVDYSNARYQPTTVDIANDPYYRSKTRREEMREASTKAAPAEKLVANVQTTFVSAPALHPVTEEESTNTPQPIILAQKEPEPILSSNFAPTAPNITLPPQPVTAQITLPITPTISAPQTSGFVQGTTPDKPAPMFNRPSRQTMQALDEQIELQRQKLKELLALKPAVPQQDTIPIDTQQRAQLKEFIGKNESVTQAVKDDQSVQLKESFKQFMTPPQAQNLTPNTQGGNA